jgi:hypothetical protein
MGEINALNLEKELQADNPRARQVDLRVFADALRAYVHASENIREHGSIVQHPRTGAPIENPYLKVAKQTGDVLARMRGIKGDRVLELLRRAALKDQAQRAKASTDGPAAKT